MKVWAKNAPNSVTTLLSGANLCASRFHPTHETVVAYGGAGEWAKGPLLRHPPQGLHPSHLHSPHRPPDSCSRLPQPERDLPAAEGTQEDGVLFGVLGRQLNRVSVSEVVGMRRGEGRRGECQGRGGGERRGVCEGRGGVGARGGEGRGEDCASHSNRPL